MQNLIPSFKELIAGESNSLANLANTSAFLYEQLSNINWLGFYLWNADEKQLILGPFQGKVACTRIERGRGVCGTAFQEQKTYRVADVDEFPGHIVCDSASRSELVIPFEGHSGLSGVLDIDAPTLDRFSEKDQQILEEYVQTLEQYI